ncbi:hypothetical protein V2J09_008517 [Rumex salicifolius]
MDGQPKLTRTQSSLLRSSPTIRSSIHSLSSIADGDGDEEDPKPHGRRHNSAAFTNPTPPTFRWLPLLAVATTTLLVSFVYLKSEAKMSTSENLLLTLTLVAVALFFAGRNKQAIDRSIFALKKLRFSKNRSGSSVEWYIGSESREKPAGLSHRSSSPGQAAREGVEFYSNGDFYEGEFHKGKCNGSGVYTYLASGRYEGDWVDGRYDGYGIESWARGSRYRGQYRHGLRHGFGLYRFFTGDTFTGEWCNGQYHGVGVQTCYDGSCFVGEFKCGLKHGLGCYRFRNGDKYAGQYFGDKIHGYGVYHFANGHSYDGSWHEGRKQGYGMYTFRSGDTKCGEWDNGALKTPLPPHTDSVLRAVQAARKAAEDAICLRRVDDQVNRAVKAANRAATAARVAAIKAVQDGMEECV